MRLWRKRRIFVELLERYIAARKDSYVQERKKLKAELAEGKSLSKAASAEMTSHWDRLRDGVNQLSSVRLALTVEVKKTRRELTGAWTKFWLLMGCVVMH